ncbi:MAG: hypothetical protein RI906_804 [Pseudomonadota bacterium]
MQEAPATHTAVMIQTASFIFAAKLSLIALSMLVATAVSRRFGHGVGGLIAGLPMILAPLVAILLLDLSAERVALICWATVANIPACVAHIMMAGWLTVRFNWWQTLSLASLVFLTVSLIGSLLPPWLMVAVAMLFTPLAPRFMPAGRLKPEQVAIPATETLLRITAALSVASAAMLVAGEAPALVSAMLLTYPINGSVLPAFTRVLYGGEAARALLRGFARGLYGVAIFTLGTAIGLDHFGKWTGYSFGLGCVFIYAAWLAWFSRR